MSPHKLLKFKKNRQEKDKPIKSFCSSISSKGLETHKVVTPDGYILSLFRVGVGGSGDKESGNKGPVLMLGGLFNDGLEWLLLEPETVSLPTQLVNEGFDVWLGTVRGTPYSKGHTSLKTSSKKYWDFGLDEQGEYDLPSMIDYILKVTQSKDMCYVGYSMGGAIILSTLCLKPEYNSKIRAVVGMCPGVYGHDFKHPLIKFSVKTGVHLNFPCLYKRPIATRTFSNMINLLVPSCLNINKIRLSGSLLKLGGRLGGGIVRGCKADREIFNRLACHMPASTSLKHFLHIAQLFHSKQFQMFDYGRNGNLKKYSTPTPPLYNFQKNATVPIALFTGDYDHLIPASGVQRLAEELPNLISYNHLQGKWAHCDFGFSKEASTIVFPQIVDIFKRYPTSTNSIDVTKL